MAEEPFRRAHHQCDIASCIHFQKVQNENNLRDFFIILKTADEDLRNLILSEISEDERIWVILQLKEITNLEKNDIITAETNLLKIFDGLQETRINNTGSFTPSQDIDEVTITISDEIWKWWKKNPWINLSQLTERELMRLRILEERVLGTCPKCGSEKLRFDGKTYRCAKCSYEYG